MKNGKRPTGAQKKFITAHGLNCDEWLVAKDTPQMMLIVHRETGKVEVLYRG